MKIDKSAFQSLVAMFADRRPHDEIEAVFAGELDRQAALRLLSHLRDAHGRVQQTETLDVSASASGPGGATARATVAGADAVRAALDRGSWVGVAVMRKARLRPAVAIADYRVRVNMKNEAVVEDAAEAAATAAELAAPAASSVMGTRTFRLKHRFSAALADGLFRADVTAVRQLSVPAGAPAPRHARLMRVPEAFELEVEYTPPAKAAGDAVAAPALAQGLARDLLKHYSVLLKVVDDTDVLMTPEERRAVLDEYAALAVPGVEVPPHAGGSMSGRRAQQLFVGPKPVTLEMRNLVLPPLPGVPTVRVGYTVTDKADGERRLLYVAEDRRVYTINSRIEVRDTGMQAEAAVGGSCLLDGEHIPLTRSGVPAFMVFDAYFVSGKDVRDKPLQRAAPAGGAAAAAKAKPAKKKGAIDVESAADRLSLARAVVGGIGAVPRYSVAVKEFRQIQGGDDLFAQCRHFLTKRNAGSFPYGIDGMIFTPANLAVGAAEEGRPAPAGGGASLTWPLAFKWKPPELNTIDFGVRLGPPDDVRMQGDRMFRAAELLVGYSAGQWEPITCMRFLTEDAAQAADRQRYVERPFDLPGGGAAAGANAKQRLGQCYLPTSKDGRLRCASGEEIVDGMVVEFSYDVPAQQQPQQQQPVAAPHAPTAADLPVDHPYRWRPLRLRPDKSGMGNNYGVALSIWQSIQSPITEDVLAGRRDLPSAEDVARASADLEGVYYAKRLQSDEGDTTGMRAFHNYVKGQHLLMRMKGRARSLFDFGTGKAGDLGKWIAMGVGRVMGIDLHADNLTDPQNGAFSRVQDARRKGQHPPRVAFVPMDGASPLGAPQIERMDDAAGDRQVARVLWGLVDPSTVLNPRLRAMHRFAVGGFDVATCMFAIHYFFSDDRSLKNFCRNVATVLRPGGVFLGVCLDGQRVDEALRGVPVGGSVSGRGWEITRHYDVLSADDPVANIGLEIKVFVESIGQALPEHLVDFRLLVQEMAEAGLRPLSDQQCTEVGLRESTGFFEDLWVEMSKQPSLKQQDRRVAKALGMSPDEKRYSFLNRWFAFAKAGPGQAR